MGEEGGDRESSTKLSLNCEEVPGARDSQSS